MYPFKKILVGLDNGPLDPDIIRYVSFFTASRYVETIYFVNVIRNISLPESVMHEFPDLMENAIEERKKSLEEKVKRMIPQSDIKFEFIVTEGSAAKKLLAISEKFDIDFTIIGRDARMSGTSAVAQRIARRAACSLMIVPINAKPKPRKILVPCDFSHHSKLALEEAIAIAARTEEKVEIICQNVYTVPVGYHYTGKTYDEFAEIMKKNAHKDFEAFTKSINFKGHEIDVQYTLDKDDDPVNDIYEFAKTTKADLVIIGAKGRTASTALFIGSKAERFIQVNTSIPMMLIRPKGTASGWLDYIKEI